MATVSLLHYALTFAAALIAGAMNSIAGGGSLVTFSLLVSLGVPPIVANATNTVALVPGSASAFWLYRRNVDRDAATLVALCVPSAVGGALGSALVMAAGDALFGALVPWLILGASLLFLANEPIARWLARRGAPDALGPGRSALIGVALFQLIVATYGGFFGAGIGILMLAALGIAGLRDIHRMNGLKNIAAVCINVVAAVLFIVRGRVDWGIAAVMAVGAIVGGSLGAALAKRVEQRMVRRAVVVIGFTIAGAMFVKQAW